MPDPARPPFPRIAFGLCVLFYAVLVGIGFDDIEEDAFIYFRFAANIADGYGYVFNIGGERIEACSGLLWLGLLTLLTALPLHLVLATKLLCFGFGVLCIRTVLVLAGRWISDPRLVPWPAFLMVASIPFFVWSVRGLETAFYWFVMLWLVDWVTDPRRQAHWWLPALALLNARPEGFVMLVAVLPYLFFCARESSRFWRGLALVAAGFVAVTVWRFAYFHDLVPHPFYFKVNPDHAQSLRNLLTYGWHAGWAVLLLLALPGLRQRFRAVDLALGGALVLSLLWTIFVFEDKAFNRHMGIALPFVYLTLVALVDRGWPGATAWRRTLQAGGLLLVVHTLLFSRYVHFQDSHPSPFLANALRAVDPASDYWPAMGRLLRNPDDFRDAPDGLGVFTIRYNQIASVGDFIRLNYRPDVVVVYDQIGQAPWYAGRHTTFIDNLGLGDRAIGLSRFYQTAQASWLYGTYARWLEAAVGYFWPGERRQYRQYELVERLLAREPDLVIARKSYLAKGRPSLLADVLKQPAFAQHYTARYLLNGREIIFERNGVPAVPVQVPPGARVLAISQFGWCDDGSACLTTRPLP